MSPSSPSGSPRRQLIANAGILIIATQGLRALTHRAVDRAAGITEGGTSYHARTRHALLEMIIDELAAQSIRDADRRLQILHEHNQDSYSLKPEIVAHAVSKLIDALWARTDYMRARYALLLELDPLDPVRDRLAERSDIHQALLDETCSALQRARVSNAPTRAVELLTLADALLMRRAITLTETPTAPILEGYLRGVTS